MTDLEVMGSALAGVVTIATGLIALLRRNDERVRRDTAADVVGFNTERLNLMIDERVLHKLGNFVMWYRPVFEGLARSDREAVADALDRIDTEVREQARLTAERLHRR